MRNNETLNEKVCRYARAVIPLEDWQEPSSFDEIKDKPEYSYLREMIELAITEAIAEEREACKAICIAVREEDMSASGASNEYQVGRQMASEVCFNEIDRRAAPKAEVSQ